MDSEKKVVFLDRDDTICIDVPYCSKPEDLIVIPGTGEAISKLNKRGYLVIIVTNQSGISRGYFSHDDLSKIHSKMKKSLAKSGALVDDIFYCSCLPEAGCSNRKPEIGLFEKAALKYKIDKSNSYMVGDRRTDILAGKNYGLSTILLSNSKERDIEDFFVNDIDQAVDIILNNE